MVELIQSFYNKNNKFKLIEFPEIFKIFITLCLYI